MPRLLLIEADALLAGELTLPIAAAGYEVDVLDPAAAALNLREQLHATRFDIALVDIADVADLATIEALAGASSPPAVLAMTGCESIALMVGCLRAGALDVLRKPFGVPALLDRLQATLRDAEITRAGERDVLARCFGLVGEDPGFLSVLEQARRAALCRDATIQIVGEHGTGKRRIAEAIHRISARRAGPLEHLEGGDPDADARHASHEPRCTGLDVLARRFAAADGGSLVVHRVADLPAALQVGLVSLLQSPAGDEGGADVRVIATSDRPLGELVDTGRLCESLRYRLDVVVLRVPPLRERPRDIVPLARHLLERISEGVGSAAPKLGPASAAALEQLPLRGNARELENLMRKAVLLFPGASIDFDRLMTGPPRGERAEADPGPEAEELNLRSLERRAILRSLARAGGNRTHASRALGISVRTLRNKIREYGLS